MNTITKQIKLVAEAKRMKYTEDDLDYSNPHNQWYLQLEDAGDLNDTPKVRSQCTGELFDTQEEADKSDKTELAEQLGTYSEDLLWTDLTSEELDELNKQES